ncbi:MAG TPA: CmcJ/NvfI family oxidoreductase [Steroidobacteraceae bacterium]|jgi:hypothetical protein|nr:CmcJ/NvfI family oxidoreductase [Steroidobacteraceae bacterium]
MVQAVTDSPGVEAELHYLARSSRINRRYVAPGAESNTGLYEPHRVLVRNGRPLQAEFSLDVQGFVLDRHSSSVADFRDKAQVDARYPAEVEQIVRRLTGADLVIPLGWVRRTAGPTAAGVQPPASDVHVDMVQDRADRLARQLYVKVAPEGPQYRRFIATSLWRAFSVPPQDWPLTVCDARSVAAEEGVPNTMVVVDALPPPEAIPEHLPGEDQLPAAYVFHYSARHRWWYFPHMTRDEVILLKLHDSDHSRAWRVPHTAFHDPTYPNAPARESIEYRTVAYFQ